MRTNYIKFVLICLALIFNASANAASIAMGPYFGTWSSSTTYAAGNVVTYSSSTYLSLVASNKGKVPSASTSAAAWQLIGGAGSVGPAGPQGPTGAPGATGPAGPQGPAYVAKAGDACTLKNSNIINTGVLTAYNLTAAPVTGKTSFLVCQDPNVWDFVQDAEVSIGTLPQFRNWTLMGGASAAPGAYNPATFLPFTNYVNAGDLLPNQPVPPFTWLISTTPAWTFGVTTTQGIGIGGTEVPRGLPLTSSEEKLGIVFTPGPNLGCTVVRWVSTFTGTIKIEANVAGSAQYFGFYKNTTVAVDTPMILSGNLVTFPTIATVIPGDAIYFIADGGGTAYLKMKISRLN